MNLPHYFKSNIQDHLDDLVKTKATPFLVLDLSVIEKQYLELKQGFPNADIYYALKANPANEVIERLNQLGSSFDLASVNELKKVQAFGVDPSRLAYGNTIKNGQIFSISTNRVFGFMSLIRMLI